MDLFFFKYFSDLAAFLFLRVDERSSDSYKGRKYFFRIFFSGKVLKFVQAQIYFFCCLNFDFFLVQFISFVKRKANSTIEPRAERLEKRDRLLVSKLKSRFQISQRNKK